jgi:hypothetical protein
MVEQSGISLSNVMVDTSRWQSLRYSTSIPLMGDFSKESLKIPMRVIRSQKLKESQRYVQKKRQEMAKHYT